MSAGALHAQPGKSPVIDYGVPQTYEIGGITVSGTVTVDPGAVKLFAGLQVGDKIELPGERIAHAIRNLWDQKLFSDVKVEVRDGFGGVWVTGPAPLVSR